MRIVQSVLSFMVLFMCYIWIYCVYLFYYLYISFGAALKDSPIFKDVQYKVS